MKLTSKSRYAVTAMLDVAFNSQLEPVSLADIAHRQHISLTYLEQLFMKLRQQMLVKSVRGPGGGYLLNRALDEISIGHIIDAVGDEEGEAVRVDGHREEDGHVVERRVVQEHLVRERRPGSEGDGRGEGDGAGSGGGLPSS